MGDAKMKAEAQVKEQMDAIEANQAEAGRLLEASEAREEAKSLEAEARIRAEGGAEHQTAAQGMQAYKARKSITEAGGEMPRRLLTAAGMGPGEEEGYEGRLSAKPSSDKEEFFDVTISRDMVGGTLGIAVDLWDGEVTVGAITNTGPADREGTLIQALTLSELVSMVALIQALTLSKLISSHTTLQTFAHSWISCDRLLSPQPSP